MLTQKIVIRELEQIVQEIRNTGIHLRRAVLFGSYSRNEQHIWSDIDIALVADEFKSLGFEDVGLFARILLKYSNLDISPRTYNTQDFTPDRDPFVEEILKTGIDIAL